MQGVATVAVLPLTLAILSISPRQPETSQPVSWRERCLWSSPAAFLQEDVISAFNPPMLAKFAKMS